VFDFPFDQAVINGGHGHTNLGCSKKSLDKLVTIAGVDGERLALPDAHRLQGMGKSVGALIQLPPGEASVSVSQSELIGETTSIPAQKITDMP
jgi:hypothetical protein